MRLFRGTNRTIVGLLISTITLVAVMTGCAGNGTHTALPSGITNPAPATGPAPAPPPPPSPPPDPPPNPQPATSCKLAAFVTNQSSNTVSVIDVVSGAIAQTVTVGNDPFAVAVKMPDRVYVTNAGSDSVSVIDAASQLTATLGVGNHPIAAAVAPNGRMVYVVNENSNSVSVIDTATNQVTATIAVGVNPNAVAIRGDGTKAYVSNAGYVVGSPNPNNPPDSLGTVSVIDTATNSVVSTVQVSGAGPLAVTPDGKAVYISTAGRNVAVISSDTNTVTGTISLQRVADIAISPDGAFAYVTDGGSFGGHGGQGSSPSAVFVIQTATGQVVGTANEPPGLSGLALTPDGMSAYITDDEFGGVRIFDTKTRIFMNQIKIGDGLTNPREVAIGCMTK